MRSSAVTEGSTALAPTARAEQLWFFVFLTASAALITRVAYSDEDAFISFRVIENFVHGYGLRWNVDERVQVFTHPLWLLALIPLRLITGDAVSAAMALSLACSTAAMGVVAWELRSKPLLVALGLYLPAWLSKSFTDYTNSGFENPLTFLLVALFATRYLRPQPATPWRTLVALAALVAVNRFDALLLVLPALGSSYLSNIRRARHREILWGSLPLVLWLLFAYFYYGVAFPNPKYAKLDGGIEQSAYLELGLLYALDILRNDTATSIVVLGGMASTLVATARAWRTRESRWGKIAGLGCGIWLAAGYVIYIGGDFMTGRHWAAPFFLALIVILATARALELDTRSRPALLLACVLLCARFVAQPLLEEKGTLRAREQGRQAIVRRGGIRDQRFTCGYYEALFGSRGPVSEHSWSQRGLHYRAQAARAKARDPGTRYVVIDSAAGKTGYFAGPDVIIIDPLGITDPLLARLPDADGRLPFAGHLKRNVPAGYQDARRTGSLQGMDPSLAGYYAELRSIVSGPLDDLERLRKVIRLNVGQYDASLRAYLHAQRAGRGP